MNSQEYANYTRIAQAIDYIQNNIKEPLNLDDISRKINLNPMEFQNLFLEWAGVTAERFFQTIQPVYTQQKLRQTPLYFKDNFERTETAHSRKFVVHIQEMSENEFENKGKNLHINYHFTKTIFGNLLVASTSVGICALNFYEHSTHALSALKSRYLNARFTEQTDSLQQTAITLFQHDTVSHDTVKLHLKGTAFQLKVWKTLLKIPPANLCTYGHIADAIQNPKGARAVGTAIGSNPIAFLIPCHRVIPATGVIGGYMWGTTRKISIIGWEAAKNDAAMV